MPMSLDLLGESDGDVRQFRLRRVILLRPCYSQIPENKEFTMRWIVAFIAGFLAVFCFHQVAVGLLHSAGVVPFAPFSLSRTAPFGVPAVVSSAFWGGLWAIVMMAVLRQAKGPALWLKAAIFGGLAPTVVALLIVFPLKGYGFDVAQLPMRFAIGFVLNALWGIGTVVFLRALPR